MIFMDATTVGVGSTILSDLILWLLIVSGEIVAFTMIFKRMTHRWWWVKPKEYSVWFNEDGWGMEGTTDPISTIAKIMNGLLGGEKHESEDKKRKRRYF